MENEGVTKGGEKLVDSTLAANDAQQIDRMYALADKFVGCFGNATTLSEEYAAILDIPDSAGKPVKALAAQIVPKYSYHFPDLLPRVIQTCLNLCQDSDATIRTPALRSLVLLCKDAKGVAVSPAVSKVTELTVQLCVSLKDSPKDVAVLTEQLDRLVKIDVQSVSGGLLGYLEAVEGPDDQLREIACKLFKEKVATNVNELVRPKEAVEEFLKNKIEKILEVASEQEFKDLVGVLQQLKIFEKNEKYGPQGIADLIAQQAILDQELDPENLEELERVLECAKIAKPFFAKGALDGKLSGSLAKFVFPVFNKISVALQLLLLQRMCELAPHSTEEASTQCLAPLFTLLVSQLPEKPAGDSSAETQTAEIAFTYVESLLYLLHQHGRRATKELVRVTGIPLEGNEPGDAFEYFKAWVVHTHEISQTVQKRLQQAQSKLKTNRSNEAAKKMRIIDRGLLSIRNITDLSRTLIGGTPALQASMPSGRFSWQTTSTSSAGAKRPADGPSAAERPAKTAKPAAQAYAPPPRRSGPPRA